MKIGFFDLTSGVSGDMLIASLCHHAVPRSYFCEEIKKIDLLSPFDISFKKRKKNSISGFHFSVSSNKNPERHLGDILEIIDKSQLSNFVKNHAKQIFNLLGEAEAKVHDTDINKIHFHEVGAVDSIIDIIGFSICLDYLKLDELYATPITTGYGKVHCAHGILPVPAPATLNLMSGIPCQGGSIGFELATPTGVANIKSCVKQFKEGLPIMKIISSGYGIGTYDYPKTTPLRFILGESL